MAATAELVIVRHGESELNRTDQFAGWLDPGLTDKGIIEAQSVGKTLKKIGFVPDIIYVSPLLRTQETARLAAEMMGIPFQPVINHLIIERFYGGLTGLNREETKAKFGEEKFLEYRRSYDVPPPAIEPSHPDYAALHARFGANLPPTECLKDVVQRVQTFWNDVLSSDLRAGKKILIAAHGNSLRALCMIIKKMTPDEVKSFEVGRADPVRFVFDSNTLGLLGEEHLAAKAA